MVHVCIQFGRGRAGRGGGGGGGEGGRGMFYLMYFFNYIVNSLNSFAPFVSIKCGQIICIIQYIECNYHDEIICLEAE